jgi:4'-phosphopantetheinyl transferase
VISSGAFVTSGRAPAPAEIWWIDLRAARLRAPDLAALDQPERDRAAGMLREADRYRFIAAHVLLRRVLSSCTGTPPHALAFRREACPRCGGPHGRPVLRDGGPWFSLSYSGEAAVLAVAAVPVGVDVQRAGRPCPCPLGPRLGPAWWPAVSRMPEAARHAILLRQWVRAEAAAKATGAGIVHWPAQPAGCRIRMLASPRGYLAAVATPRQPGSLGTDAAPGRVPGGDQARTEVRCEDGVRGGRVPDAGGQDQGHAGRNAARPPHR